MKPDIKKLLILNAPYLLFVWLFMKIGEAFRLSPGADLSGKLLHIMETEIQELAERTAEKLKKLTEDEFAGLVFLPAEDME